MRKKELIDYCLTLPNSIETYPFNKETTVMKHCNNKKMFALIYEKENNTYISLKCDPLEAEILRENFKAINAGYHLNKKHWNTIDTNLDLEKKEILTMIKTSYNLIKPKK